LDAHTLTNTDAYLNTPAHRYTHTLTHTQHTHAIKEHRCVPIGRRATICSQSCCTSGLTRNSAIREQGSMWACKGALRVRRMRDSHLTSAPGQLWLLRQSLGAGFQVHLKRERGVCLRDYLHTGCASTYIHTCTHASTASYGE
jgi:hypothetical protein